jgi:uncharacterized protein YjdB
MRKSIPRLAAAMTAPALSLSFAACSGNDGGNGGRIAVTGVTISPGKMTLTVGGPDGVITAAVVPPDAANKNLAWITPPDGFVAVAGNNGGATVAPVLAGKAAIAVRTDDGGFTESCAVTVVEVAGVTLDQSAMFLVEGAAGSLVAGVLPACASQRVKWDDSPPGVVRLEDSGADSGAGSGAVVTVVPLAQGEATITATSAADDNKTAKCIVTVSPAPASVVVSPAALSLAPKATGTLTAAVLPVGASRDVTWVSGDTSVAEVVGSGPSATVTGIAAGTVEVTATAVDDATVFGICVVTVEARPAIASAMLSGGSSNSLAIKADGGLLGRGANYSGQPGDGTEGERRAFVQAGGPTARAAAAAGDTHTLGPMEGGGPWAWGTNGVGQLGDGANTNGDAPAKVGDGWRVPAK